MDSNAALGPNFIILFTRTALLMFMRMTNQLNPSMTFLLWLAPLNTLNLTWAMLSCLCWMKPYTMEPNLITPCLIPKNPYDKESYTHILAEDLYIPLQFKGTKCLFHTQTPTLEDLATVPRIHITSDKSWNPTMYDLNLDILSSMFLENHLIMDHFTYTMTLLVMSQLSINLSLVCVMLTIVLLLHWLTKTYLYSQI